MAQYGWFPKIGGPSCGDPYNNSPTVWCSDWGSRFLETPKYERIQEEGYCWRARVLLSNATALWGGAISVVRGAEEH